MVGDSEKIKISVILPVYNVALYIQQCIDSLKSQSFRELEFIFVDDGSTDGSVEAIEEFAKEDNRVRILHTPENQGAGPARNMGIDAARGEYLSFIDPDDWISADFYELLYARAVEGGHDIVKGVRVTHLEDEKPSRNTSRNLNNRISGRRRNKIPLYCAFTFEHQTAIYKAWLFRDGTVRHGTSRNSQDTTFLLKVCSLTDDIVIIEGPEYFYRYRPGAATYGHSLRRSRNEIHGMKEKIAFLREKPFDHGAMQYLYDYTNVVVSDIYYADEETGLSLEEKRELSQQIREAQELLGKNRDMLKLGPEAEVFLEFAFPIPVNKKRDALVFQEGIMEWSRFFQQHPEAIKSKHYRGFGKAFLRSMYMIYKSPCREKKKGELAFCRKCFSGLSPKQKLLVFTGGMKEGWPSAWKRICGMFSRRH